MIWLSTPICSLKPSARYSYMKRQMMPAPTKEMAMGMKTSDLRTFSPFDLSINTA